MSDGPSKKGYIIPKSNTARVPRAVRGIIATSDGDVRVLLGDDLTIPMIAGQFLPISPTKLFATGTTVTSVIGLE